MQSCLIRIAVFAPCTCGGGHGNAIRKWVKMKYAIIAAGEGSRLAQEGIEAPKPLVVVNGEKLIDRLLRIFTENAAEEIVVICNNLTPLVAQHLDHIQRNGLHGQRIPLRYVVKTTPSSMHSFFEISHLLNDSPFCLTTVDTIFREDDFKAYIKHFVQAVEQGTADGVMGVTDYIDDEKPLYVAVDDDMRITAFLDADDHCRFISGGIYGLTPQSITTLQGCMQRGESRMRNFQRALIKDGQRLEAMGFSKVRAIVHASDIAKAEAFLSHEMQ